MEANVTLAVTTMNQMSLSQHASLNEKYWSPWMLVFPKYSSRVSSRIWALLLGPFPSMISHQTKHWSLTLPSFCKFLWQAVCLCRSFPNPFFPTKAQILDTLENWQSFFEKVACLLVQLQFGRARLDEFTKKLDFNHYFFHRTNVLHLRLLSVWQKKLLK